MSSPITPHLSRQTSIQPGDTTSTERPSTSGSNKGGTTTPHAEGQFGSLTEGGTRSTASTRNASTSHLRTASPHAKLSPSDATSASQATRMRSTSDASSTTSSQRAAATAAAQMLETREVHGVLGMMEETVSSMSNLPLQDPAQQRQEEERLRKIGEEITGLTESSLLPEPSVTSGHGVHGLPPEDQIEEILSPAALAQRDEAAALPGDQRGAIQMERVGGSGPASPVDSTHGDMAAVHGEAATGRNLTGTALWTAVQVACSVFVNITGRQKLAEGFEEFFQKHDSHDPNDPARNSYRLGAMLACAAVPLMLTIVGAVMEERRGDARAGSRMIRAVNVAVGAAVVLLALLAKSSAALAARVVATTIYAGLRDLIQTTLPLVNRGQPLHGDSLVPNLAASVAYVPNQVGVGSGMVELASPSGASAAHSQFSPGRTLGNDVARGAFGFAGELTDAMVANTAHAYKEGVPLNMHIEPRNPLPHLPQVFTGIGAARPNWLNLAVLGPGLLDQCLAADSSAAQVADMLGQHLPGAEKCVGTAMRLAEKFKNIPTTALEAASLSLFYTPFMMQGQPQRPALPPTGPDV